jgi:hypothetical protein
MVKYNALLSESGNFQWGLLALVVFISTMYIKLKDGLHDDAAHLVDSLCYITASGAAYHLWFAYSRHSSTETGTHNLWMMEWRWLLIQVTAFLFSWGCASLLQSIMKFSDTRKIALIVASYIFAFTIGVY